MPSATEIIELRKSRSWSQAKVAEEASKIAKKKVNQQTVDRIEKGGFSRDLAAVLAALGAPAPSSGEILPPSDITPAPDAPAFQSLGGLRDVPELGIAVGGADGDFAINGSDVLGYLPRPAALLGRKIFAVRVRNDSMEPKFEEGDILYVEWNREPRPGDFAVIEMKPTEDGSPGRAFIKRLVSKSVGDIFVEQFKPVDVFPYPRDVVKALYRVVPNNELFGV